MTFSASTPQQCDLFCAMIGREDLLEDPAFGTFPRLKEVVDEIDDILRAWTHEKTRQGIVQLAVATWSVPVSPILDIGEAMQDPQYTHRGLFE